MREFDEDLEDCGLEELYGESTPATIAEALPPTRQWQEGDLQFIPDSPEFLTQTIDASGWRQQLEQTFLDRIAKVRNNGR